LDRLGKADPLAEDGPRRQVSPATLKSRRHQIFKAASALATSGFELQSLGSLAILVEPDNFKATLQVLLDRNDGAPTEALFNLACALRAVATHHVKLPKEQLDRLRRIAARLEPEDSGLGRRTEERLRPFEDDRVHAALLRLPAVLLHEAEQVKVKVRKAALLAQVAIAIEIALLAPLRLKNLLNLNLERHVQVLRNKKRTIWIIRIPLIGRASR
jgi:hypothetical protein